MRNYVPHYLEVFLGGVEHMGRVVVDFFKYVELGGAVIVFLSLGIVLGQMAPDPLSHLDRVVSIIASFLILVMGVGIVWLTRFDERRKNNLALLVTVASLCGVSIVESSNLFTHEVHDILFSIAAVVVMAFLFNGACRGCQFMKFRGGDCGSGFRRP
jgi:hypothetical protein